jgi:hypothetical protein
MQFLAAALFFLIASPSEAAPSFTKEAGIRVSSAIAQASSGAYPDLRIYYIRGSSQVFSAKTADGLALVEEPGVRVSSLTVPPLDIQISSITGLSLLPLSEGGFRMLYSVIGSTGAFRIYSATSADGLAWANDTGTRINVDGGLTFAGYPSLIKLDSGDWRLFYIQNSIAGNQIENHHIFTALSNNQGLNFGPGSPAVAVKSGQVAASLLTNKKVRLFYTAPLSGQTTFTTALSALSTDAHSTVFNVEQGIRLSTGSPDGSLSSPFVIRSTHTFSWRLYYNFTPPGVSTAAVYSAVAEVPDPQSLSPSTVFRSNPAASLSISGEVFSLAPAAKLTQSGQADIPGTALVRSNDQTITATFDTNGKNLGFWNLLVTNSNGQSTTLPNALFIDFLGGSTRLTDNLIRPRQGTSTKIDVTIFKPGRTTLKLYTLNGELIRTLFDQEAPEGTFTVFWDGKTSLGRTVSSGLYLLQAAGPKLNVLNKIVVIK